MRAPLRTRLDSRTSPATGDLLEELKTLRLDAGRLLKVQTGYISTRARQARDQPIGY
jgi:hypothetical protein